MISAGYKSAYQQGYSDAMRDFRKKSETDVLDEIFKEIKHMKRFKAESLGVEEHCDYFDAHLVFQEDVLYIIDKYREE